MKACINWRRAEAALWRQRYAQREAAWRLQQHAAEAARQAAEGAAAQLQERCAALEASLLEATTRRACAADGWAAAATARCGAEGGAVHRQTLGDGRPAAFCRAAGGGVPPSHLGHLHGRSCDNDSAAGSDERGELAELKACVGELHGWLAALEDDNEQLREALGAAQAEAVALRAAAAQLRLDADVGSVFMTAVDEACGALGYSTPDALQADLLAGRAHAQLLHRRASKGGSVLAVVEKVVDRRMEDVLGAAAAAAAAAAPASSQQQGQREAGKEAAPAAPPRLSAAAVPGVLPGVALPDNPYLVLKRYPFGGAKRRPLEAVLGEAVNQLLLQRLLPGLPAAELVSISIQPCAEPGFEREVVVATRFCSGGDLAQHARVELQGAACELVSEGWGGEAP